MQTTKLIILLTFFGVLAGLSFQVKPINAYSEGNIIISEINAFGSTGDCLECSYDKWIEIKNTSSKNINLEGWKIRFFNSSADGNNILLNRGFLLPNQTYLLANKRSSLQSILTRSNIKPNQSSGKVLYLSNQENSTINVQLVNPDSIVIQSVSLSSNDFEKTEGVKKSLEYQNGVFVNSSKAFYANNYGSPTSSILLPVDKVEEKKISIVAEIKLPATNQVSVLPSQTLNKNPQLIQSTQMSSLPLPVLADSKQTLLSTDSVVESKNSILNENNNLNPNFDYGKDYVKAPNFAFQIQTSTPQNENSLSIKPNVVFLKPITAKEIKIYHSDVTLYLSIILIFFKTAAISVKGFRVERPILDKKF